MTKVFGRMMEELNDLYIEKIRQVEVAMQTGKASKIGNIILVQKFGGHKKGPFQTEWAEVCANSFYIDDKGNLVFKRKTPYENIAIFACGTWYQVKKVKKCCDECCE